MCLTKPARELPINSRSKYFFKHILGAWYGAWHRTQKRKNKHAWMTIYTNSHQNTFINVTHLPWGEISYSQL